MYLDMWRSGTFHSFCIAVNRLSESKKHRQDYLMLSAQLFYSPYLQLLVHLLAVFAGMCRSHCMWLSFTRPSPH